MKKTVVLDCDSALLNFVEPYAKFMRDQGYKQVYQKSIKSYHFAADFGIDAVESKRLFNEFTDYGGFRHMTPYPGVHDLFDWFHHRNIEIVLATDVPTRAQNDRILNLQYHKLSYGDIIFGPHKAKVTNAVNACLVLDDHINHINDCLENTSVDVYCPTWPYNQVSHPRLTHLGPPQSAILKFVELLDEKHV
jgi:phosphoglycolate phosphatase-like HAD superfamily hydrolase